MRHLGLDICTIRLTCLGNTVIQYIYYKLLSLRLTAEFPIVSMSQT
jgi:hypothetical protein